MVKRDFLSIDDLSVDELGDVLGRAAKMKKKPERLNGVLSGQQIALIFEKPSTRTRVSFEVAVTQLGGNAIVLRSDELQLGRGETVGDTGRVLNRFVDALVVRTFDQERLDELAAAGEAPVINALSDHEHPCQALADLQTIAEVKGQLEGLALAYLGDGNNVAHSLMLGGAKSGMDVRVASPPGYQPDASVTERARAIAAETGGKLAVTDVVAEAAHGADVVYTDVWTSMGQDGEAEARRNALERFQVNRDLLELADDHAIVMHCLPAHRGEEIAAEVMDGPRSVVWDQAENRLHSQKALLAWLLT
ncbi:MAG: ornithine carbamoyltransferase [Actinomycetota bacterium]